MPGTSREESSPDQSPTASLRIPAIPSLEIHQDLKKNLARPQAAPSQKEPHSTIFSALAQSTIGSPGTLIFTGASLMAFTKGQHLGSALFLGIMALACWNRFEIYSGRRAPTTICSGTFAENAFAALKSPIIDFMGSSLYFAITAVEAAASGSYMVPAYVIYSAGEYLAGKLQQRKLAARQPSAESSIASPPQTSSTSYSNFMNPAIYFATGNTIVSLVSSSLPNYALFAGLGFASATVFYGLCATSDGHRPPGGGAFRLHSMSQLCFGVAAAISQEYLLFLTFFLWAPTSMMQARDMDRERDALFS